MEQLWERQKHRVALDAAVRLCHLHEPRSVDCQLGNLSATGLMVQADEACSVGTELLCELPLGGAPRLLRGRVAWVRRALDGGSPQVAMGIELLDLRPEDREALELAIGPALGHLSEPVRIRFEGVAGPIRGEAVATPGGLRLRTPLPFLKLQSGAEVEFLGPGVVAAGLESARIRDVRIGVNPETGVPRLEVDLDWRGLTTGAVADNEPGERTLTDPGSSTSFAPVTPLELELTGEPVIELTRRRSDRVLEPVWLPAEGGEMDPGGVQAASGRTRVPADPAWTAPEPAGLAAPVVQRSTGWTGRLLLVLVAATALTLGITSRSALSSGSGGGTPALFRATAGVAPLVRLGGLFGAR